MRALLAQGGWTWGLAALLVALLALTRVIQPDFGASGLDSLARSALPFALAACGMAVVVIAGGIDLSIAAMMAVASVTAATLMAGGGDEGALTAVALVLALGLAMGTINGLLVVLTRVPDIVVTLAMLYVWGGVALLILNAPGGGAAPLLRGLIVGGLPWLPEAVGQWIPRAVLALILAVALIWGPIARSRLGLMLYAIGSDRLAAYRSGVPVGRVKVISYAIAGLFAALGGLSVTLSTGIGEPIPGPYLLASVAAVVLGGVALTGGKGGLLGPILAVFVLRLVRLDLTLMNVDPNVTTIVEGAIMVAVVMFGGLMALRGRRT